MSGHMDHSERRRPPTTPPTAHTHCLFCIFSTYRQEVLPEDPYCHLPQAQPNAQYSQILNGSVPCLHLGSSVIMSLCPPGLSLTICFFQKKLTYQIVSVCSQPFRVRFSRRSQSLVSSVTRSLATTLVPPAWTSFTVACFQY